MLHPLDRYRQFLAGLRDPSRLVVAAIAGDSPDRSVSVIPEGAGWDIDFSCRSGPEDDDGARPGIRLRELVGSLNKAEDTAWAYTSICAEQYRAALGGIGQKITLGLDSCPPRPSRAAPIPPWASASPATAGTATTPAPPSAR